MGIFKGPVSKEPAFIVYNWTGAYASAATSIPPMTVRRALGEYDVRALMNFL
jgi:hypothetical protein